MEFKEYVEQRNRMLNSYGRNPSIKSKCSNIICSKCPLSDDIGNCLEISDPAKAEIVVSDWATAHPVMTNAMKFEEVFGFELFRGLSGYYDCIGIKCPSHKCDTCKYYEFWSKEYVKPECKYCGNCKHNDADGCSQFKCKEHDKWEGK